MKSTIITALALATTTIPPALAQNSSLPLCLTNNMETIKHNSQDTKGQICGLSLDVNLAQLNLSTCCSPKHPETIYKGACGQFCQTDENQVQGFIACSTGVAQAANVLNQTGATTCWRNSAMKSQVGTWNMAGLGLCAIVLGMVSFV
ncbi:hypothetical protein VTL71DRAFT_11992 [Oculimacula yallundae]|uniref:Uncharacterized protein n=1 Tax=Oculimacula yallundae TaxID=86028 RepID=A0ABR4CU97_9HELO